MQQDVGNIIWLDHIHLEVPDLDIAHLFYGTGTNACSTGLDWQQLASPRFCCHTDQVTLQNATESVSILQYHSTAG